MAHVKYPELFIKNTDTIFLFYKNHSKYTNTAS